MSPQPTSVGGVELALLRHVIDQGPQSVREVADSFGARAQLARTTVLTMMERLRKKKLLRRRKQRGTYRYEAAVNERALLREMVGDFVDQRLSGRLSPFIAFLAEDRRLSDRDVADLRRIAAQLEQDDR